MVEYGRELVKVCKNGTKIWNVQTKCDRCGGQGGSDAWKLTGYTCYKCNGTRRMIVKVYEMSPEHAAEVEAKRKADAEKQAAEYAEICRKQEEEEKRLLQEREQKRAEERARKAISQYQGEIGDKVEIHVKEAYTAYYQTHYTFYGEDMCCHVMTDDAGNKWVWRTKKSLGYYDDNNEWQPVHEDFIIKGVIKDHTEYKDEKQNVLTRCKVVLPASL